MKDVTFSPHNMILMHGSDAQGMSVGPCSDVQWTSVTSYSCVP